MAANFDLQKWNVLVNETLPLNNEVLAVADEGKPGYDCKGFVAYKIAWLHKFLAYDLNRFIPLTVLASDGVSHHEVVLIDNDVFDNLSPWLNKTMDYKVLGDQIGVDKVQAYLAELRMGDGPPTFEQIDNLAPLDDAAESVVKGSA